METILVGKSSFCPTSQNKLRHHSSVNWCTCHNILGRVSVSLSPHWKCETRYFGGYMDADDKTWEIQILISLWDPCGMLYLAPWVIGASCLTIPQMCYFKQQMFLYCRYVYGDCHHVSYVFERPYIDLQRMLIVRLVQRFHTFNVRVWDKVEPNHEIPAGTLNVFQDIT